MENEALVRRYQTDGDGGTLGTLYEQNKGLIGRLVSKYPAEIAEDLRQEAFCSLARAARVYKDGEASFASFLYRVLAWDFATYAERMGAAYIPAGMRDKVRAYRRAAVELRHKLGRTPTGRDLRAYLRLSPEEQDKLEKASLATFARSFDEQIGEDGLTLGETIGEEDPALEKALDDLEQEELRDKLEEILGELDQLDGEVVRRHYLQEESFGMAGDALGISEQEARRRGDRAMRELRRKRHRLAEFAEGLAFHSSLRDFLITGESATEKAVFRLLDEN